MNEQRLQAYLSLIQELLDCPSGEENQILSQNLELLDGTFVQVCEQVAEQLQSDGQENNAGFLRNVAQEVGQYLNSQTSAVATGEGQTQGTEEDYLNFLIEVLGAIEQSQGNPQVVYPLLQQNLDKLDLTLAETLPNWVSQVFGKVEPSQTYGIAGVIFLFGNLIQQFPLGNRADNMEIAIASYESVLKVFTRDSFLEQWAKTQNNLGRAYINRTQGNRSENIEFAINTLEAALEVFRCESLLQDWAMTQNNLANAYLVRIKGNKKDNIEVAISYAKEALKVVSRQAFNYEWARSKHILGSSYLYRIEGSRENNLEIAINTLEIALEFYTREAFPYEWSSIQMSLGETYRNRIRGKKSENLESSIAFLEASLEVYTREAFPYEWASIQMSLGETYRNRIRGKKAENLESSIAFFDESLQVYTCESFPDEWARTQNNLGAAYLSRIQGERAENLERAIFYLKASLQVYTREAFPEGWAKTQNNLGAAYLSRIQGERVENQERAISCLEVSLEVYTREAFPYEWSSTQNNLGGAYLSRIQGERAENLERAISFLETSLEVYTREDFPYEWARTQMNLGEPYRNRIRGERAENLERAITFLEASLEVYTREAFPYEWANTQMNLTNVYRERIRGEKAENLERAIICSEVALEIYTRAAFPQEHTKTLVILGLAYQAQSHYYSKDPIKKRTALQNAYIVLEQALDTVEYLRGEITSGDEAKRKLNEESMGLYVLIVEVCLELGRYTAAIEYVDRSKARNLVELIATRDAYPQGVIPPEINQRLQHLRNAIAEEDRRLKQDPNPDYTRINQMREERQQLEPYKPLHFEQIQALLDEETAILEWYILGDKFLTFTLMPDPPLTPGLFQSRGEQEADPSEPPFLRGAGGINIWQSSKEDLNQLIDWGNAYLKDYYSNKTQWHDNLSQRLETLAEILHLPEILQNLWKEFPNCKKLILIPHLYLHLFPLHALPIPIGESEVKSLQELFKQGVTYAPNCQLLQQAQTRYRPNFKRLFAVQNPTNNLSYADLEVETIRRLFPDRSTLQKHNATKANFLAKDLRQTHHLFFSCHAGFNLDSPLDSGLELADDILTLEEIIASLNLSQCSLVTLSACETGQVAIDDTDEYISLSSGFILAGSPTVLVSLWSVDDVSTALLLIKTYETLQNHPGQIAIALKTAQIWLRDTTVKGFQDWARECQLLGGDWQKHLAEFFRKLGQNEKGVNDRPYQSPYHWAAFCVVGQGEQKMASDSDKIQAFTDLLSNHLLADYLPDLEELKPQLGDDEEKNAEAIEQWLNTDQRQSILTAYQEQLKSITSINPLLGVTGEKGIGGSKPNPKTPNLSLKQLIENTTKDNTKLPKSSEENPPQS